jgi:hypothetical protein
VEAVADLAERAHAGAGGELLQLALVEIEEAQRQHAAAVLDMAGELAPRAILDVAFDDLAFDQHRLARRRFVQGIEPRLVVVAQRQVEHEIELGGDAELGQPRQDRVAQSRP